MSPKPERPRRLEGQQLLDYCRRSGLAPRERLFRESPAALTDLELVALILGTGSGGQTVLELGRQALELASGLRGLASREPEELVALAGVGRAKAARLVAAFELGRRVSEDRIEFGRPFLCSDQVFRHFYLRLRDERQEIFSILLLDVRNRLIAERVVSRGSLVASLVHPREVFRPAIQLAAASVIAVHNHPSGDPSPSTADIGLTDRLARAGELVGIALLDHLIVGESGYTSFSDSSLGPFGEEPPPTRAP